MAPALEILRKIEATSDLKFRFTEAPAGANHYRETGTPMPDSTVRLCEFSFRRAEGRKARGRPGQLTCVDKANVFKAFAFFREMFDDAAKRHPDVKADRLYVDACSALLVKRPWDFDVMVMENMFGDILSDMTAGLIGGMG